MKYQRLQKILFRSVAAAALAFFAATAVRGEVRWLNDEYNFGAFDEDGGRVPCSFRFVNMGPDDIAIKHVRPQCGCTSTSYTHRAIAPGDTGVINAEFNPVGRPGRFRKDAQVVFSDGTRATVVMRGVVIGSSNTLRSRYPVEAGRMKMRGDQVSLGTVFHGRGKTGFLEVYNGAADSASVVVAGLPASVRVKPSVDPVPPGEQCVLAVTLTPGKGTPYGILTDSMQVSMGDSPAVTVGLQAIVEEDFTALTPGQLAKAPQVALSADRVDFGQYDRSGGLLHGEFTIANKGKDDLLLRRVYTLDPGVELSVTSTKVKRGKTATVKVTVDPTALPAPMLNARVQVIVNDPANPLSIVRLVGEERQEAR
ncbi:MAG: DUF1573 domain-containing protein [Muribaculaceae bacterium]|nr:DUF1573 domain-containing protein [Muribaculaceae bacterium]